MLVVLWLPVISFLTFQLSFTHYRSQVVQQRWYDNASFPALFTHVDHDITTFFTRFPLPIIDIMGEGFHLI